jgi:predicted metal-dependent HD superfamily phosphohydrolase
VVLLIDTPTWPAHGTVWSHLVSDASLLELRTFARAHGLPDRGFDHDHVDVPADRHHELVAAGAVPVDGRELARRLAASGLRVPGRERRRAYRPALLERWEALWASSGGVTRAALRAVGEELVDRWREPHRVYHSRLHLADTLDALDLLVPEPWRAGAHQGSDTGRVTWRAAVALWLHDAVHDGATPDDEERSAALARELLAPLAGRVHAVPPRCREPVSLPGHEALTAPVGDDDVEEVARLVLLTAGHDPAPEDVAGALVCDADLAILGATPARYGRYVHQVRAEYGHVPDDAFRAGRAAVLEQLLDLPALFRTPAGRERWAAAARRNLRQELDGLRAGAS